MTIKIPPPPNLATQDQQLNRWLLELTSILNDQGLIDPTQIDGLVQTIADLTASITTLNAQITTLNASVAAADAQITTLNASVAAQGAAIAVLQARSQVLNGLVVPPNGLGSVGDWYADVVLKHIYVKTGAATWTLIV